MATTVIGNYRIERTSGLFADYVTYYKNDEQIARKRIDRDGSIKWDYTFPRKRNYIMITRSQAFHYWEKHFPNTYCWELPELLERATESDHYIIVANGEIVEIW